MGMLHGITVLDVSSLAPGAYTTSLFAQLGARVIKVERPLSGDPIRTLPVEEGQTDSFVTMNVGKRSVVIDLKTESGWEDLGELIARSDVLVSNYTASTAQRLGLSYERVRGFRNDIIMASITGFSSAGPMADAPGHDLNFIAASGTLSFLQGEDLQMVPEFPLSDAFGGTAAAFAIAAALFRRFQTGEGEHVRISLTDSLVHARVSFGLFSERAPEVASSEARPGYGLYETQDGRWLAVGVEEDHFWREFCGVLGLRHLEDLDPMGAGCTARHARQEIAKVLRGRTARQWSETLNEHRLPVCLVYTADEAVLQSMESGSRAARLSSIPGARYLPGQLFLTEGLQDDVGDLAPELGEGNATLLRAD